MLGNLVFGLVLFHFQLREERSQRDTQFTAAKILQSLGWLLLYFRGDIPDLLSCTLGNVLLLCGMACECGAIFRMSGRSLSAVAQTCITSCVVIVCFCVAPWPASVRITVVSLMAAVLIALTGWAMLWGRERTSLLRVFLGGNLVAIAVIVLLRGVIAWISPEGFALFSDHWIQKATFVSLFYLMLTDGFGMLLLAKEAADGRLAELVREQKAILDTLPTGLCILHDRMIERCNPAMEAMFGYGPGTLAGRSTRILYESDESFEKHLQGIHREIERMGRFEGEVPHLRRDGDRFWALYCATTIFPGRSQSYTICSVADMTEHRRQHEKLEFQKRELESTLARTKRLEGIISICMHCKRIHDRQESWEQLERYISTHSDAMFSHGICPDCYTLNYAECASEER